MVIFIYGFIAHTFSSLSLETMDLHGIFHWKEDDFQRQRNVCCMWRSLNIQPNYIFLQDSIRMAPDDRAGLVQEMNDALCNQICKGDLARRMHTDKLLLSLDIALRTLNLKLWGIAEDLQDTKRAHSLHLFKSKLVLTETQALMLSKHWYVIDVRESVFVCTCGPCGSLSDTPRA